MGHEYNLGKLFPIHTLVIMFGALVGVDLLWPQSRM
jgi:hypothetical protein